MRFCYVLIAITIVLFNFTATAFAGRAPGTGMAGSVHDLNMFNYVFHDEQQRICIFCHTPHNANPQAGALWSRELDNSNSGLSPYTWTAPANQDIPQTNDPLIGPSRLCMTCHDGTIALDTEGHTISSAALITTDLHVMHPIGFSYDDAMAVRGTAELVDKNTLFASGINNSNSSDAYNGVIRGGNLKIADVLYAGSIVTCMSCHDVHNEGNVTPDPGHDYNFLLWAKEEQSLICLSCHVK